jgi:hypothetical protein
MVITKDEFDEWLQMPTTKAFKKALFSNREEIKEGLIQGAFDSDYEARGMAKAIQKILLMDYEDLIESLKGDS